MDGLFGRSRGVTDTLAIPVEGTPGHAEFERLYRASRDDVYAYVATMLRDRFAAEDVTALAFERAYRRRSSFRPGRGSPRAWLFGIARNAALDELRRRSRAAPTEADPRDEAALLPDDAAETSARRAAVRAALESLSRREVELVALKFFAGLSNAELAAVLGTSETNAGTRLHRALQKLREACHETA
jgi:RNA polymerase sigma-70 factor (ECF subfamily)